MIQKFLITCPIILFSSITMAQEMVTKVVRKGEMPVVVSKSSDKNKTSYTIGQFTGRWQEISRRDRKTNAAVEFTDTLFYHFTGANDVFTRDGVKMSMRGKASVEPGNELLAAADVFDIKSVNARIIVLDDRENYLHTFMKKKIFWYETFPTDAVVPEKYNTPINARASDFIGNWNVYRRDAEPGVANEGYLLKAFNLTKTDGNNVYGSVTYYHADKTDSLPGTITLDGENVHIVTSNYSWGFTVYKANGNELVFGNKTLTYFCKPW